MRIRDKVTLHVRTKLGRYYSPSGTVTSSDYYQDWYPVAYMRNYCADVLHHGPPYREAGPVVIKFTYNPAYMTGIDGDVWRSGSGKYEYRYNGRFWCSLGMTDPVIAGEAYNVSLTTLSALGTKGWNKFQPAKPIADLGTMLGESRELPRQFSDAVKALKQLASHPLKTVRNVSWLADQHLATQFGWLPLMRDLEKGYEAIQKTQSWLDRVKKYNGQWEHRGGTISEGEGSYTSGTAYLQPVPTTYSMPPEGLVQVPIEVTWGYRVWFSAWFKYYVSDIDSPETQLRLKARIFGLQNTPRVVWNLLPWSWLADWFTNLGDNFDNLVPIDGLVAKKPCVMRHLWTRYFCQGSQRHKNPDGSFTTLNFSAEKRVESKERSIASPFGFGVTDANLSARQLSLLAALGIQRIQ